MQPFTSIPGGAVINILTSSDGTQHIETLFQKQLMTSTGKNFGTRFPLETNSSRVHTEQRNNSYVLTRACSWPKRLLYLLSMT